VKLLDLRRFEVQKVKPMPGQRCTISGNNQNTDPDASFRRIPQDSTQRAAWLSILEIREEDIIKSTRVCCRHFPGGNTNETPDITLGTKCQVGSVVNVVCCRKHRDCRLP